MLLLRTVIYRGGWADRSIDDTTVHASEALVNFFWFDSLCLLKLVALLTLVYTYIYH